MHPISKLVHCDWYILANLSHLCSMMLTLKVYVSEFDTDVIKELFHPPPLPPTVY